MFLSVFICYERFIKTNISILFKIIMLFLISFASAFEFVIKSAAEDLYLGDVEKKSFYPILTSKPNANIFKIKTSECDPKEKIFCLSTNEDTKLFYDENADKLGYYTGKTNDNQKFEISIIDFEKKIMMVSQGNQCLTYNPQRRSFVKQKCDSKNVKQLYQMIEINHLHPIEQFHIGHEDLITPDHLHHYDTLNSHICDEIPIIRNTESRTGLLEHELMLKDAEIKHLRAEAASCGHSPTFSELLSEKAQEASDLLKKSFIERSSKMSSYKKSNQSAYRSATFTE